MKNFNFLLKKSNIGKCLGGVSVEHTGMFYNYQKKSLYNKKDDIEEFGNNCY
jgi:hypothetical protein